jgi:hypothetical protein
MVEVGLRIWDALAHQLPAACKSRAGRMGPRQTCRMQTRLN